ncbi:MAG: hypothetical protein ACLP01_19320 [Solirubrobacteraceae bacterium]
MLFAALGTVGRLIALLVFVYPAPASSGGTVPLQRRRTRPLPAEFEPLRQILGGVSAIPCRDGHRAAG